MTPEQLKGIRATHRFLGDERAGVYVPELCDEVERLQAENAELKRGEMERFVAANHLDPHDESVQELG